MKKLILILAAICIFAVPSKAWNCSDPLAARVPVASGTTGSFGSGDGQLFLGTGSEGVKGQLYECKVPTPTTPSAPGQTQNQSQTQSSNSNSQSSANSTSSAAGGNSTSTAAGGSSTATGGSSVLKNSGNSTLKNSGNSSNENNNTNTANGGTGVGGNQSQTSTSSAANNGNNANNASYQSSTTINESRIPVATAFANANSTVSCFKGIGGGLQLSQVGASFTGGKIDKNCVILEAARFGALSGSRLTFCKVYITHKAVKAAGVTLDDCMHQEPVAAAPVVVPAPVSVPQITVPVTIIREPAPVVPVAVERVVPVLHTVGTCTLPNGRPSNQCLRLLDDAILALNQGSSKIVLTGPVESGRVVEYLRTRGISQGHVVINLADDQNWNLKVETQE